MKNLRNQLLWLIVYVVSAAVAFNLILAILNSSFSTGFYWKAGESRFKAYRHHSVQYQLFNAKNLATADVIVIGDTPFLSEIKEAELLSNSQQLNLPAMSLVNLMVTLSALDKTEKKAKTIILFNAPWQWSTTRAGLLGGAQDMSFYNRLGKFNMKRDKMKLSLIFMDQLIKRPEPAYTFDQFKRPAQFNNVNFDYPPKSPAKKTYHNNVMRMLKKYDEVIWVNDPNAIPESASSAFKSNWDNNLSSGSEFLEVGIVKDMKDLVK